jgi:DnaJ family protein B protein 12
MDSGPGMSVHWRGRGNPRRESHDNANEPPQPQRTALRPLLVLLLLIVIPLLLWFFSGSATTYTSVSFENAKPYTQKHVSTKLKVDYYVNPKDTADYTPRNWRDLSGHVENSYVQKLGTQCEWERTLKQRAYQEAQGFWSRDPVKWQAAENMATPACHKLKDWGYRIN